MDFYGGELAEEAIKLGIRSINALADTLANKAEKQREEVVHELDKLHGIISQKELAEDAHLASEQAKKIAQQNRINESQKQLAPIYAKYGWDLNNIEDLRKKQQETYKEAKALREKLLKTGLYSKEEVERKDLPILLYLQSQRLDRMEKILDHLKDEKIL